MKVRLCVAQFAFSMVAAAQVLPGSAHVELYFPQFADGGGPAQQWQTTFTFVNPNPSPADVMLKLRANDGRPLPLDLGLGALASDQKFTVKARGSRVIRSNVLSDTILTGWAMATSNVPVQATVAFRCIVNGKPQQEITAEPTLPTLGYLSFARGDLGIAIANVRPDITVNVVLALRDGNGTSLGEERLAIPALNHLSFNLTRFFNLPNNFEGALEIRSANPPVENFIAWTLNSELGILSALPPGAADWPISHWARIRLTFSRLVAAAMQLKLLVSAPSLEISDTPEISVRAVGGHTVRINSAMSELISDSQSELAFVIAHEIGHITQMQLADQTEDPSNLEFDADIKGTMLVLASGYDPYAGAGALAKLSLAAGRAGLIQQIGDQLAADALKSFNARLEALYGNLLKACSDPEIRPFCAAYKAVVHPHIPTNAPLAVQPSWR